MSKLSQALGGVLVVSAVALVSDGAAAIDKEALRQVPLITLYAGDEGRSRMTWYQDVVYDETAPADAYQRSLDIYVEDPQPTAAPVLVYIHGGARITGDKAWVKDLGVKAEWAMLGRDYVFVSINYRLGEAGAYPVAQQDTANALAWIHDNIAEFGGDPDKIIVMGHSAGAALTARVATMEQFLQNAGKDLGIIKAAITIDGGNFDVLVDEDDPEERQELIETYGPDRADWLAASPLTHVEAGKDIPPFLLLTIGNDGASEIDARKMAEALTAAGIRAEVAELIGYNHFTANELLGVPGDSATVAVERFLDSLSLGGQQAALR